MPYTAILVLIGLGRHSQASLQAAEARQKESYKVYLCLHTFQS